ncbi:dNA topoisomerase [Alistipes sp. CAG:435]|jgi:DNA topoisomerase-1|nr:type I DNA topoisomerase [Alistipes sp.]MEE0429016.1 type I DNA topoisomerase [Bacteroidales bacterium]CDD17105.1 dNA topoisomerase [Alistipes sp. CAG:435]
MADNLVIVESPAKAKTIQKFLGNGYEVKSSFGHIRDLQDKKLSVDVERNFTPEYVIPSDKKKVVAELKKAAASASTVWLASDEDREGEAISWHLFETLGLNEAHTRRIVFHEITKDAIVNAVRNPRSIDMNLVNAQQARRVLDRLVGFELSPVLWRKIQPKLSAGRVQSVALRLVVEREKEIMAFENEAFYKVEAFFHPAGFPAAVKVKAVLDTKFKTIDEARKFLQDCIGADFTVSDVEKKEATRFPAAPFTTSTLQQEAARKLRFPVSMTMRVAQSLYERGLITYMRTDSTNLSTLALGAAKKFITGNFGPEYSKTRQFKTHSKGAQEAHEAIRPTYIENTEIEGTAQEQKLYNLIWKRTVASQMADAKVLNTTLRVASDKRSEKFNAQATQVLFDGFLKLYIEGTDNQEAEEEEVMLPDLQVGTKMEEKGINAECKFTAAPPRYSEATLVKKLEELGIGRPSTYAPTIATLTTGRGYIVKGDKEGKKITVNDLELRNGNISEKSKTETVGAERGRLLPQEIGMIVTDYLEKNFTDIMGYDFTANVEKEFDQIADGNLVWNDVIGAFYTPFHKKVDEVLHDGNYSHVSKELGTDSEGNKITAKFGKFGPYIQKGEGEKAQYASLGKDQLIENITLEDALKMFQLPRTVGEYNGVEVIALKGRFGPFLKYGDRNFSIPRGKDPLKITLDECAAIIEDGLSKTAANSVMAEYKDSDIQVINGRYGPYIKHAGSNYKIPKETDAATLTEAACLEIINNSKPTEKGRRHFKKS